MPQPTQNSLIHILLLWTTTLSLVQAVIIILFFTTGQRDLSQNNSAVALQIQANNTPSYSRHTNPADQANLFISNDFPSKPPTYDHKLPFGQMLTYKAKTDDDTIRWRAKIPIESLISETGKDLQIQRDGYYFINLQVTLKKSSCPCEGNKCEVSVKSSPDTRVVLQGWINNKTCSTGPLGKVEVLSAKDTLEFKMDRSPAEVNDTESLTYLNIIYMSKTL